MRSKGPELNCESRGTVVHHRILDLLPGTSGSEDAAPEFEARLVIKTKGRIVFLNVDDIDWVEAAANYVRLNVGKESYLFRETISGASERLNPSQFIRIHRSMIVNVGKIKELIPVNSGEYVVVLKSGKELSCSRGYRANVQYLIDRFLIVILIRDRTCKGFWAVPLWNTPSIMPILGFLDCPAPVTITALTSQPFSIARYGVMVYSAGNGIYATHIIRRVAVG